MHACRRTGGPRRVERWDLRRLQRTQGAAVFASGRTTVEAVLDALRRGWIVDPKLNGELLAVVDEVVRAYRVLTAVAIDDAIPAKADPMGLDTAQHFTGQEDAVAEKGMGVQVHARVFVHSGPSVGQKEGSVKCQVEPSRYRRAKQ